MTAKIYDFQKERIDKFTSDLIRLDEEMTDLILMGTDVKILKEKRNQMMRVFKELDYLEGGHSK